MRTIRRASKAAALVLATMTMSFGSASYAQDENRAVASEAEVENTAETSSTDTYVLDQNDSFRLLSMPTETGRILFMQINEDVRSSQVFNVIGSLADGDYSAEGHEFAVVYLEGNIGEYGGPVLELAGRLRNISGYNVAVAYQRGSEGEPRASLMFSDGMAPSQTDMPIATGRDLAILAMNVSALAPSRDNPGVVPAASAEQSNEG